jgi:RNA-dependent RNA polymerase
MFLIGANMATGIELAKLHSKAVDYVKTGVPAIVEKALLPQAYPHFMEKKGKKEYRSTKVLGQLFDRVATVDFAPDYKMPFDDRILKRYTLDNELLKKARRVKSQYDTAMRRIMGQMEIRTEFEILSTFVMSKPKVGTAYKLHEIVRREAEALRTQFKEICVKEAGGSREHKQLAPFVAAMYQVTAEEVRIALYEARTPHLLKNGRQALREIKPESMPLISFPWLFDGVLGRIAKDSAGVHIADEQAGVQVKDVSNHSAHARPVAKLDHDAMGDMEYARTADGRVIHRGEILRLFHLDGDDNSEGSNDSTIDGDAQNPHEPIYETPPKHTDDSSLVEAASVSNDKPTITPEELLTSTPQSPSNTSSGYLDVVKSSTITKPHVGTSWTVETDHLIDLFGLPDSHWKASSSALDRSKLKELAQRLRTVGPETSDDIPTSAVDSQAMSPTLCNPLGSLGGKTDAESALDPCKPSDAKSEIEIEEVTIGVRDTASALEHLAKFSY